MIEVSKSPFGNALWTLLRQIALVFGGWAIGRGYLAHDTAIALGTVGTVAFPIIYGQVKGWIGHNTLIELANSVPDTIAKVK